MHDTKRRPKSLKRIGWSSYGSETSFWYWILESRFCMEITNQLIFQLARNSDWIVKIR